MQMNEDEYAALAAQVDQKIKSFWELVSEKLGAINTAELQEMGLLLQRFKDGDQTVMPAIMNNNANKIFTALMAKIKEIHPGLTIHIRDRPVVLLDAAIVKFQHDNNREVKAVMRHELTISTTTQNIWSLVIKVYKEHVKYTYNNNWGIYMFQQPLEGFPKYLSFRDTVIPIDKTRFHLTILENKMFDLAIIVDVVFLGNLVKTAAEINELRAVTMSYLANCIGEHYYFRSVNSCTIVPSTVLDPRYGNQLNLIEANVKPWSEFHTYIQSLIPPHKQCVMCNVQEYQATMTPMAEGVGCIKKGDYCSYCFNMLCNIESGSKPN